MTNKTGTQSSPQTGPPIQSPQGPKSLLPPADSVSGGGSPVPPSADRLAEVLEAMERQMLRDRDAVIGAQAVAATAREDLARTVRGFRRNIKTMQAMEKAHQAQLRRAVRTEVAAARAAVKLRYERSVTWRIGCIVLAPLRLAKRLVRRG